MPNRRDNPSSRCDSVKNLYLTTIVIHSLRKVQIVSIGDVKDGRVDIGFSNGSVGSFSEEMAAGWTVGKEIEFSGSLGRLEVNLNNSLSIGMSLDEAKNRFPPLWVIYDHAREFNAQIVVRVLFGMVSEPLPALLCDSLKEAREFVLSRGATVNLRHDPFVLEVADGSNTIEWKPIILKVPKAPRTPKLPKEPPTEIRETIIK